MGRQLVDIISKFFFWNSKNGKQKLSDRARKLKSGDLISCRVIFDAGIHSKAVGFEFKRSGLYTLAMKDEQKTYIYMVMPKK